MADTPLAALKPHPQNYNRHSEEQIKRLMDSLERFGQPKEIVTWQGTIIAGHGLVEAAQRLGLPTLRARDMSMDWTETEAIAFMAADNELARLGDPDEAALAQLVAGLGDVDAQLAALAAGTEERVKELLATLKEPPEDPGPQIDKAEELREKWGVETGQLWQLGEHRLICGDCTDAVVVARVMGGEKAQACVTDPPYGTASESKVQKRGERIETFDIDWDKAAPIEWIPVASEYLDEGAAIICFWDNKEVTTLWDALESNGFNPLQTVYWKKTTVPQPRPNFCSSIESAVFARKKGGVLCWNGGGATPNVFEANRAAGNERTAHETQKPINLFSWLVELISNVRFVIYDPFLGSGTTLIACERLNRRARCVEISPAYCAVALERFYVMSGKLPVLVSDAGGA